MSNDESYLKKISESITVNVSGVFSWLRSDEGQLLGRTVSSLASFALGDPTGIIVPTIFECADITIRKRVLKHFPDLVQRMNDEQSHMNMEFVKSESGQQLLKETIQSFVKEIDENKIETLKTFLLTAYSQESPDVVYTRKCFKKLLDMDPIHLQILSVFMKPENAIRKIFSTKKPISSGAIFVELPKELNEYYFKIPDPVFTNSLKELEDWGILTNVVNSNSSGGYQPNEIESEGIPRMINALSTRITPFGNKLIEFLQK